MNNDINIEKNIIYNAAGINFMTNNENNENNKKNNTNNNYHKNIKIIIKKKEYEDPVFDLEQIKEILHR